MTRYLLTVHGPAEIDETGNYGTAEARDEAFAATEIFNDQLRENGNWVFAGGLESATKATVVNGLGEKPVVSDGPFLEAKEYLAGFWIIEAPDHDTAVELATEASRCCGAQVEVRSFDGWS